MKVIVFGATGGTGRAVTVQALELGHEVSAFVRDPARLGPLASRLHVIQGDVLDPAAVRQAVAGHDAVVSAIGMPASKTGRLRSEGTRNIVRAMQASGVRRLVSLASLGYGDSRKTLDRAPLLFKYVIVPFILREGFADHARQEEIVKASGLDWIIVRPANLTDGPRTGRYRHGFSADDKALKLEVSRADVAEFMLHQLTSDAHLRQTPGVSY